jgi:hypothetical protein
VVYVCFRPAPDAEWQALPSALGATGLEIHALEADSTQPRGIFHNQYFSTLAGASTVTTLQLVGSRLAIPASGRLSFSKGTCGALGDYDFSGTIVKDTDDTTAPTFVPSLSFPLNGNSTPNGLRLTFSERLDEGEMDAEGNLTRKCDGNVLFVDGVGTVGATVACEDLIVLGNSALVYPGLAPGTYTMVLETGVVSDEAGNALTLLITDTASYEFDTAVGKPEVLATNPADEASADAAAKDLKVYMSAVVAVDAAGGSVVVRDCGADYVCETADGVVESFTPSDLQVSLGGKVLDVTLGDAVTDKAKYSVTVPADLLTAGGQSGPLADFTFELTLDGSGFDSLKHTLSLSSSSRSTADELFFDVQLGLGTEPGTYSVCYCSGQEDESLSSAERNGDTTYKLREDRKCDTTGAVDVAASAAAGTEEILGFSLRAHACEAKCAAGCLGSHCYCQGYTGDQGDALCLPKAECAAACDLLGAECTGINVHDDLPQCVLLTTCDSPDTAHSQQWQFFEQEAGAACTHFSDFTETAGTLAVTARVDVGVDYIVAPNQESSLEITGAGLMGHSGDLLSADRITVIDFGGTCGVSSPTASLSQPANAEKIGTWSLFWPKTYFYDEPSIDSENTAICEDTDAGRTDSTGSTRGCAGYTGAECGQFDDDDFRSTELCCVCGGGKNKAVTVHASEAPSNYYGSDDAQAQYHGFFCAGNNVQLDSREVALDGALRSLDEFSCHAKCSQPCDGDHCYCDGYMSGYDTADSNAICASENVCKFLCDQLDDCASIDMHMTLNRCYLNTKNTDTPCVYSVHDLARDSAYKVIVRQQDPNDYPTRRLQPSMLPISDQGFSWSKLLRFGPIEFKSGGTFKLCFCDSALLGGGQCNTVADYAVEVGKIHSSGVSCLLGKPELQRVACTEQYWGGLRCYRHMDAPQPAVPAVGAISREWHDAPEPEQEGADTFCMFQGEEVDCQTVSGYQSAE